MYTLLQLFHDVLNQLKQDWIPLFCDKGVFFYLTRDLFQRFEEFKNNVPIIWNFHLLKAVKHFLRKCLKRNNLSRCLGWRESFGVKTLAVVIPGSHYVRSLHGMLIIFEVIEILRWVTFSTLSSQRLLTKARKF